MNLKNEFFKTYFHFSENQGSFQGQGHFGLFEVIFVNSWSMPSKIYMVYQCAISNSMPGL